MEVKLLNIYYFFVKLGDSKVETIPKMTQAVWYEAMGTTLLKE